jgi:hypothetical protein
VRQVLWPRTPFAYSAISDIVASHMAVGYAHGIGSGALEVIRREGEMTHGETAGPAQSAYH